jgi:xylulokinase
MTATWLGIDLGTSAVKAALIDAAGAVVAAATAPLEVSRPHPGWSEQDPDAWIAAATAALDALARDHPAALAAARGIGLSGQMHGATLLDAADRPLRPCLLWNDARAGAACVALDARADFRGIGGNLVMAGFTAPKLEWVRVHEPDLFARVATVLLPKDFLRLWLTGEKLSDMSDSAGTLWLDVGARRWSPALLAATGLTERQMPGLVEGSAPAGRLRPALAARWGMAPGLVVAGGGGDNAASACGVGAVAPDAAFLSIGTSGVLFVSNARFSPNPGQGVHAFCHAIPDTWHQMGVILSAADSLVWLGEITGRDPAALAAMVDPDAAPPEPLTFLPYLSGERTPLADAGARGVFAGLSRATSIGDLARAVLEGVADAFGDCADALRAAGAAPESALAVGGGARSDAWLKLIADATGLVLERAEGAEAGAALGAARLGFCAAEGADPRAACVKPPVAAAFAPDPARAARRAEARARHRALWPAVRDAMG